MLQIIDWTTQGDLSYVRRVTSKLPGIAMRQYKQRSGVIVLVKSREQ